MKFNIKHLMVLGLLGTVLISESRQPKPGTRAEWQRWYASLSTVPAKIEKDAEFFKEDQSGNASEEAEAYMKARTEELRNLKKAGQGPRAKDIEQKIMKAIERMVKKEKDARVKQGVEDAQSRILGHPQKGGSAAAGTMGGTYAEKHATEGRTEAMPYTVTASTSPTVTVSTSGSSEIAPPGGPAARSRRVRREMASEGATAEAREGRRAMPVRSPDEGPRPERAEGH